jgi:diguanylate cyclase (GGDEF)-like protein/PAS domain S-box-containing protein
MGGTVTTSGSERAAHLPAVPGDVLDLLPLGVAELDGEGRLVRVNSALAALLGYPRAAVRGRLLVDDGWRLVGDDAQALVPELLRTATAPCAPARLCELAHDDGRRLSVRLGVSPARTSDPDVAYVAVLADVTAEAELQRRVSQEHERYRLLADHVGDVVLVCHRRRVLWASPSVSPVLGVEPDQLTGRQLTSLLHPDDQVPVLTRRRPTRRLRLRLRGPDGGHRWFAATVAGRWHTGDGGPTEVYITLRDIDDQVAAEQAAALTEQRLRLVFDASPDAYAVFETTRGADGEVDGVLIASANAAALGLWGRTEDEVIGRDVRVALAAEVGAALHEQLRAVLAGGVTIKARANADPGTGPRIFDAVVIPVNGTTVVATWRDVTDAVEGERLLERAYEETAEMRATLQTALDATSDGFAVYELELDEDAMLSALHVVHANEAGAGYLGLDPTEMVGMEIREVLPTVQDMGLWDRIVDATITKAPQHYRTHVFDEDTWLSSWDYSVAPVGEERIAITWRDVSAEEGALRQLARHRDEAMHSATHDALTGLPNRILLRQHLQEALRTCSPTQRIGIIFVDLDRFKPINDTYGHAAGDAVLKATAERLLRLTRHGDLAARLAGDEFVLVLTQLPADWTPDAFFTRARAVLSESLWTEGAELHPSASLGLVIADPRSGPADVDVRGQGAATPRGARRRPLTARRRGRLRARRPGTAPRRRRRTSPATRSPPARP